MYARLPAPSAIQIGCNEPLSTELYAGGPPRSAALSAVGMTQSRRPMPPFPQMADVSGLAPPSAALNSQSLALGKLLPSLTDPDATEGPFVVNTLSCKDSFDGYIRQGEPGNSVFLRHADARATIPWAPLHLSFICIANAAACSSVLSRLLRKRTLFPNCVAHGNHLVHFGAFFSLRSTSRGRYSDT
jgi:hypothetical protein